MTEKQLRNGFENIYKSFENIQCSFVEVERHKERFFDVLNVSVNDLNIQIGLNIQEKWLYVTVNLLTVCSIQNGDMSLKAFYDIVESTLLDMLDDIVRNTLHDMLNDIKG